MRVLIAFAVLAAGIGAASAQTPPPPQQAPQRPGNANLRPVPDGPVGKSTRFGTLEITVSDCLVNVPEAPLESVAHLTIIDHKPGQAEEKLFAGWMFASTPSLSALDHGVYDLRVLSCTMAQGSSPPSSR
jgi:hypothetical protein